MLVFGHFVLVPMGYLRIVLFLKRQNKKVAGKIPKKNWAQFILFFFIIEQL